MTDRFVSITVLSDPSNADSFCSILEEAGIPVLIQHLVVEDGAVRASGYRVLAPAHFAQTALRLLNLKGAGRAQVGQEAA